MSFPEPIASISTPLIKAENNYTRPRRHTITRPDSAMAMLSDGEDEDEEQQKTFDRISGILSNLIQEANEAVNGIEKERVHLLKSSSSLTTKKKDHMFTSSTIITTKKPDNSSKIPRPRKSRQSLNTSHSRNPSTSSTISSTSTLVSSPTAVCRSPSPTQLTFRKQYTRRAPNTTRRSMTPKQRKPIVATTDPILESYKRLDSSMALVDSLSRDLATPKTQQQQRVDTRLTILLLIPLLHIPHSLITMVFDFFLNTNNSTLSTTNSSSSSNKPLFNFTTMIFWACVFTVTNLMVDQTVVPNTKNYLLRQVRRMSLPGTYKQEKEKTMPTPAMSTPAMCMPASTAVPVKRTWIPTTIQKQYQFHLGKEMPIPQKRRNSI